MSGPRSLRAAFEACQPLRKPSPYSKTPSSYRSFYTSRASLLAEPSLSPSEKPSDSYDLQSRIETPQTQPITRTSVNEQPPSPPSASSSPPKPQPTRRLRFPRAVQASYLQPLRYKGGPTYNHPVCTLQLRSFSVRNVEFMADFAMRAAFYLKLRARGPVPLPKIVQRWTVLRSNFINKNSQENFERITLRRLIQIQDGHTEVVKVWLAYLRRYAFWGVGMKANVWEFEGLDVAGNMDKAYLDIEQELDEKLSSFGYKHNVAGKRSVPNLLRNQGMNLPGRPMMELRGDIKRERQPHLTESIY
ncbi:hypothetical protein EPUS_05538 [Endocarpon pusillum Z07020]|uniref:Small ribosomal subunit protein uS10m n=1 Tax=Endocarpon pusillum (strain Z07020 / HMAS-L-300199) TaxID=1263415 RepID=U1GNG4_ENDPU|nr:uncharacterized protein EPUS_05538 [Endocarpon pusillum Z07020]ERF73833.1 hypothetical protein EPUS_05538 [Endocarpon pusillum Z07020]